GHTARELPEPEREQHHEPADHRARGEDETARSLDEALAPEAAYGVGDGRDDDRHRPGDTPPAALRVHAREDAHAHQADDKAYKPQPTYGLTRFPADCQEHYEDRHRCVRNRGDS